MPAAPRISTWPPGSGWAACTAAAESRKSYGPTALGYNRPVVINRARAGMGRRVQRMLTSPWVTFLLVAVLALLPAGALAKGRRPARHRGGGPAAQKRLAITSAEGGGPVEGPVRAQIARILAKAK